MTTYQLLINGRLTPGASTMRVINPATEAVVAECARADAAQVDLAVQAAKAAFPAWSALTISVRREKLMAIAGAIEAHSEELARLLTAEQGKPLAEAAGEVGGAIMIMRMLAAFDLTDKVLSEDAAGRFVEHRKPLGVVAAITPWNYPISLLLVKITPALLAGNTVVAKPAPTTPLTSLRIAELANAHLPPGVLNMITDQNDLGTHLTTHPDVAKISFTGSTATGKKVMQSAASTLKRVTLELGGNDAAIVLDGMDPKEAAASYEAVCAELARLADAAVVGDGAKPGVQFGPIQNKAQFERVKGLIDSARQEGKIIAGGTSPEGPGYFVRPTIVRDLKSDARLVREEQFGPVLPVLRYEDLDAAIAAANDTPYGLGGTVWSANPARAAEVARKLNTGIVWVNTHMMIHPGITTGGAKQSGMGTELGVEGLEEYTQRHLYYVAN